MVFKENEKFTSQLKKGFVSLVFLSLFFTFLGAAVAQDEDDGEGSAPAVTVPPSVVPDDEGGSFPVPYGGEDEGAIPSDEGSFEE